MVGRSIVVVSCVAVAAFVVIIVPDVAGLHGLDGVADGAALALFLGSLPVWCYAFGIGIVRSGRGDDVGVANLFFLQGSAPAVVRRQLTGALVASVVAAAATAWSNPFAVLVPMFPLAMLPLWAARHGTFPARRIPVVSR